MLVRYGLYHFQHHITPFRDLKLGEILFLKGYPLIAEHRRGCRTVPQSDTAKLLFGIDRKEDMQPEMIPQLGEQQYEPSMIVSAAG